MYAFFVLILITMVGMFVYVYVKRMTENRIEKPTQRKREIGRGWIDTYGYVDKKKERETEIEILVRRH